MEETNFDYYPRVIDILLEEKLKSSCAVLVQGPKYCGKTTSSKHIASSVINFQDALLSDRYILQSTENPWSLFNGEPPILFDEWQDAPNIWKAVRQRADEDGKMGQYILTGSVSRKIQLSHSGAGRIARLTMYPMSLYESKESNGMVSLSDLFYHPENVMPSFSDMTPDDIIFSACRGGWPSSLNLSTKDEQLSVARNLYDNICHDDMSSVDGKKRRSSVVEAVMKSLARNICTQATNKTILSDINLSQSKPLLSYNSISSYIDGLKRLYVIEDVEAWCPAIREKSNIRISPKKNFVDPSIAVAALNVSPEYYQTHFRDFGAIFESLCIRDIKIYSSLYDGKVSFFRDKFGIECDIVLHLRDGKYALMECKFSQKEEEKAAKHLNLIEEAIKQHDLSCENPGDKYGAPAFKAIITGSRLGHKRQDGVYVVPLGCLKY